MVAMDPAENPEQFVIKVRTIRQRPRERRTEESEDGPEGEEPAADIPEERSGANLEPAAEREPPAVYRQDVRIARQILKRYGYSDDCPGCRAQQNPRLPGRSHTPECRGRLEQAMLQDERLRRVLEERDAQHGLAQPEPTGDGDDGHQVLQPDDRGRDRDGDGGDDVQTTQYSPIS